MHWLKIRIKGQYKARLLYGLAAIGLALVSIGLVMAFAGSTAAAPADGINSQARLNEHILYVKPGAAGDCGSWATACELQTAISQATGGQEIWVAAGLYKPTATADRTINFQLKDGVALYGGFAGGEANLADRDWDNNLSVLSGDIDNNDTTDANGIITDTANITGTNSYHVIWGPGVSGSARLDGFTITGGKADSGWPNNAGAGMFVGNGSPTLGNLIFQGNMAFSGGGGGMRVDGGQPDMSDLLFLANSSATEGGGVFLGFGSNPVFKRITFQENEAGSGGGAYLLGGSESTFSDVTFRDNQAAFAGGGLFSNKSTPVLTDTTFIDNKATQNGGGLVGVGSDLTLSSVTFIRNQAGLTGGGMYNFWETEINRSSLDRVIFVGNSSTYGGALRFWGAGLRDTLTNVSFSGNRATQNGGAIHANSVITLTNASFSGNQANIGGALYNDASGKSTLYNLISWGNTATTSDPELAANGPVTVNQGLIQGGCTVTCLGTIKDQNPQFVRNPSDGGDGWGTGDNDDYGDLRLKTGSPAENAGVNGLVPVGVSTDLDGNVRIVGAAVDLGAYEIPASLARYYVDWQAPQPGDGSSWTKAFQNLQTALIYGPSGVEIWVAKGDYHPGLSRFDTFNMTPGVALYGGFDNLDNNLGDRDWNNNPTILSGDIENNDLTDEFGVTLDADHIVGNNSYHVVKIGAGATGTTVLDGFTVTGGNADASTWTINSGGGIFTGNASPALNNLRIVSNGARYGGGMRVEIGNPILTDVVFEKNSASSQGGGLFTVDTAATFTRVTFAGNRSNEGGGIYNLARDNSTFSEVTFSDNQANFAGGGMLNLVDSNNTLNQVDFINNKAGTEGGGIYNGQSSPVMTEVTFVNNRADGAGGAMANRNNSHGTLNQVEFSHNEANDFGGGFFGDSSSPTMMNTTFFSNTSPNGGGGMFVQNGSSPKMSQVTFEENRTGNWGGGGMGLQFNSHPVMTDVNFINNVAAAWGGGLTVYSGSNPVVTNALFENNRADANDGGGMYNGFNSQTKLRNATFIGNKSLGGSGGGLFNETNSDPELTNVVFSGNGAKWGGGLYNWGSGDAILNNVTFSGNYATIEGGGLANGSNSNPLVQNTILWANTAPTGTQVFNYDTSVPAFYNSLVQDSGGSSSWDGAVGTDGGNNIDADPLFNRNVNLNLNDYGDLAIKPTSPAKDKGNNAYVPVGVETDLVGNPRITGVAVDMGAYEVTALFMPVALSNRCVSFPGHNEVEENDEPGEANGDLCPENTYSGNPDNDLNQGDGAERDWYTFNWSGNGTVEIDVSHFLAKGQVLLYYQSEFGASLTRVFNQADGNYHLTYTGTGRSGRYYLQVFGDVGHSVGNGDYTLKLTVPD